MDPDEAIQGCDDPDEAIQMCFTVTMNINEIRVDEKNWGRGKKP